MLLIVKKSFQFFENFFKIFLKQRLINFSMPLCVQKEIFFKGRTNRWKHKLKCFRIRSRFKFQTSVAQGRRKGNSEGYFTFVYGFCKFNFPVKFIKSHVEHGVGIERWKSKKGTGKLFHSVSKSTGFI